MLKAKARLEEEKRELESRQRAAMAAPLDAAPAAPAAAADPTIDLEHAIAFTGSVSGSVVFHPNSTNYITVCGGCVGTFSCFQRSSVQQLAD